MGRYKKNNNNKTKFRIVDFYVGTVLIRIYYKDDQPRIRQLAPMTINISCGVSGDHH